MYFEAKPPKLVKDNTCGLVDAEQTNDGSEKGQAQHDLVIGDRQKEDIVVLDTVGLVARFALDRCFAIDTIGAIGRLLELGARRANWLGGGHRG